MATYSETLVVNAGTTYTGQAANLVATFKDKTGSSYSPTVGSWTEFPTSSGSYYALATIDITKLPVAFAVTITGSTFGGVAGVIGGDRAAEIADGYDNSLGSRLATGIPNVAPAANGGLPTVNASNYIAGIQGSVNNLNNLDAAVSSRSTYAGGAVASVTGNVGGNVVGSVASVAGNVGGVSGVTFPATVPSLAQIQAGLPTDSSIATDVQTGLTAQGLTTTRAGYMDVLNGLVAAIWAAGTRTLTAFGFTVTTALDLTTALSNTPTAGSVGAALVSAWNGAYGKAVYTAPASNPGTGSIAYYGTDGTTVLHTKTVTTDANGNVTQVV